MADLERGQRIKARRVELQLTQPELVDLIETLAWRLPADHPLHPAKAGKAPVTLRGLQTWEHGGGVASRKAKLLAEALQTDTRTLIVGVPEAAPEPVPENVGDRLDRIENRQTEILDRLDQLQTSLEHAIRNETRAFTDETAEHLSRLGRAVLQGVPQEES